MSSAMAASAVVPPLRAGECQVWWARPAAGRRSLLALLDAGERGRCARFHRDADRARYLAAHALARLVLAGHLGIPAPALSFRATCRQCGASDHGKPRLRIAGAGLEFSLSHSGARVVLAVARDAPVGVDVERLNAERDFAALVPAVLSAAEQPAVAALPAAERAGAVLRYWTRKEALLKATGDGLGVAPAALTVTPPDVPPALVAWEAAPPLDAAAHLFDLSPGPGHVASLAVLGPRLAVVERDGDPLLAALSATG
ncbi:MAG TPA: 4'-phosphopantetheinyl transferase superfamily protein [Stellaceae bacterium]|nr:4'-phosphopantetheinyl transferase superfamily protein [Stellaceae bacterium]